MDLSRPLITQDIVAKSKAISNILQKFNYLRKILPLSSLDVQIFPQVQYCSCGNYARNLSFGKCHKQQLV